MSADRPPRLLLEVSGIVAAPLEVVSDLLLTVRPGPIGPDNAWLLGGTVQPHGARLTGGPERFNLLLGEEHLLHVDVDRRRRMFGMQGHWWYRAEYWLEPHRDGTRLIHRVYNAATWMRWGVPLANRLYVGFRQTQFASFQAGLERIGTELNRAAHMEG